MAIIPLKEALEGESVNKESGMAFRWKDILSSLMTGVLILMFIYLPEPVELGGVVFDARPLIVILLIVLVLRRVVVKVDAFERLVVLRMGKFKTIAQPGWHIIFPIAERFIKFDMRMHVYEVDPQEVVTKDKIRFMIAAAVFMFVTNPKDAALNVSDYKGAVLHYIVGSLRSVCGRSTSDYIVTHMEDICEDLEHGLKELASGPMGWGIEVPRIEIKYIQFPDDVQYAMHRKVVAGQLKLASHERAEAIKVEIDAVREASAKLTDPAITYLYLEALDKIARGKATKIILPLEISKIAETITRRTGANSGAAPAITPDAIADAISSGSIPPELIEKYMKSIEKPDKPVGEIETKLTKEPVTEKEVVEKEVKEQSTEGVKEQSTVKVKEQSTDDVKKESTDEVKEQSTDDYSKRIKEIKKRVGIE